MESCGACVAPVYYFYWSLFSTDFPKCGPYRDKNIVDMTSRATGVVCFKGIWSVSRLFKGQGLFFCLFFFKSVFKW